MAFQRPIITDFSAGELGKKFHGRSDLAAYGRGLKKLVNWVPFTQGGITTRPALKYLGESYGNQQARYIPFVVGATSYEVELTPFSLRIWQGDDVKSLPNPPIAPTDPITTPWSAADIAVLQYAKVRNQLYFVCRGHPIQVLTYEGLSTFSMEALAITFCSTVDKTWTALTAYAVGDVVRTPGVPQRAYKCVTAGISGISAPTDEVGNSDGLVLDGTVYWSWEFTQPFSQEDDYPGAIAYFNGRMWYGGSLNQPDTIWASLPYDFGCFDYFDSYSYTGVQLKDASLWASPDVPETETLNYTQTVIGEGNAIQLQLASENDESVMWLAATDFLVVGTGTSEWVVTKDVNALNVEQCVHIRSRLGSYEHQAMVVTEKPMFLQGTAAKAFLWEYAYKSEDPELTSADLSYLADHMLEAGVSQMDFVSLPQPMWLGVTNGKLAMLLYAPKYNVAAWFWLETDGTILSVCVVPGATDDAIYLQVLRNGRYCFERLEKIWEATIPPLDSYQLFDYSATHGHITAAAAYPLMDHGDCQSADVPHVQDDAAVLTGCTFDRSTERVYQGTYSRKLIKTVAAGSYAIVEFVDNVLSTDLHGFVPGRKYKLTIPVNVPTVGGPSALAEVALRVGYYDSGAWTFVNSSAPTAYDVWQTLSAEMTLPATATGARAYLYLNTPASIGEYIYAGEVKLRSPVRITSAAHPFLNDDLVRITGVLGMTELNGNTYMVKNRAADTFELYLTDGTTIMDGAAVTAYISGGLCEKVRKVFSGLTRLEGETVGVYADGVFLADEVVAAGAITIDQYSAKTYIGLPYTCSMQSLNLQAASSLTGGSAQGQVKRISAVVARVLESLPFKAGYSDTLNLETATIADDAAWTAAYSGDVRIPFQGKWGRECYLWIVQDAPKKTTILALYPELNA